MKTQNNSLIVIYYTLSWQTGEKCISEYSKIKKCIPNNYLNFLKNENEDIDNEAKSRNKMKLLNNLKLTDIKEKIVNAKDVKVKIIQKILNKKSLPKCQDKWNNFYNEEFHWRIKYSRISPTLVSLNAVLQTASYQTSQF